MRASRGMGAINSSKMPNKKTITRTDNPDEVSMYKKGGSVKCYNEGSLVGVGEDVDGGSAGRGNNGLPILPPRVAPKPPKKKVAPKKPFNTIPDAWEDDGMKKGGRVKRK